MATPPRPHETDAAVRLQDCGHVAPFAGVCQYDGCGKRLCPACLASCETCGRVLCPAHQTWLDSGQRAFCPADTQDSSSSGSPCDCSAGDDEAPRTTTDGDIR